MKIKSNKNIKKNRKHSKKNVRKNKRSKKNVGKYSRKNVMRGGVLSAELTDIIKRVRRNDTTLTTLNISRNNIGCAGAQAIAGALKVNTTLTTLDISDNNIGVEGAKAIAEALKVNTTLTTLNIYINQIGVTGAEAIAEVLEVNKTITELYIDDNNIGDEGAKAITGALKKNTTLTTLDISSNDIGDEGADAIALILKENTTLTTLNISNNKIGDEGADALVTALSGEAGNKSITTLNISHNNIGDDGAKAIAGALKRNNTYITYVPILETLKNTKNNSSKDASHIEDAIRFIDTILKKKDIIKNKSLNNTGKEEFVLGYKKFLSKSVDISNFKKLISNNYTNGNKALTQIDTSNKYIIDLHGTVSNNIFKLPDNINIIFLSPISYIITVCNLVSAITLENIKQYIENPYCANNNPFFKEAILYLGGQYCIDLNLTRYDKDGVSGIHYVSESKIEEAHIYSDGDHSFTLSKFLETGKDYTQKMLNKDNQYTFIVIACRDEPLNKYEYHLMDKLVFYEISIKILNFYLHFINKDKRAKMNSENNKNETIENKYSKCKTKKHKVIYLEGYNEKLKFLQLKKNNKGFIQSRNSSKNLDDETVVKIGESSVTVTVGDLKRIVNEIDDNNKQNNFILLIKQMNIYRHRFKDNNKPMFQGSIFLNVKQIFDIIKYIFQDKYDLMFEFIVYIDLKLHIINFGYFKDLKDLKTKIDVSKINYRINLSALKFIVTYLEIKNLITLNICCNKSRDYGIEEIIKTLKDNTTITTLDISRNEFGDKGAEHLANMLKLNTTLTTLDINHNRIGVKGARALAEVLKSNKSIALTTLNISNNSIGNNGVTALAEALKLNKTLTTLNVIINGIDDEGVVALIEALKLNKTLTTLDISNNNISMDKTTEIQTLLDKNKKLLVI